MFNPETCKRCGLCFSECPIMEMPTEKARHEIERIIQTGELGDVSKNCAGCGYCNVICPTGSNPMDLRRDILGRKSGKAGAPGMTLICEDVPLNLMTLALESEKEEKEKDLQAYTHPEPDETVFYLGCSLSHLYTDLAHTSLLSEFPVIGGMKYCCGGYVRQFGDTEVRIKGRQLADRLNETGIKKLITFCPGCDHMLQDVYPDLVEGFDFQVQPIFDYLLERHQACKLAFPHPLNKKVTFHDSCAWRSVDEKIYEGPRQLLECMGATVVEMKHNRRKSICCGTPLSARNPALADQVAQKRVEEARTAGADVIAVSCTGCFALNKKAAGLNIEVMNITELAQMAIGEKPPHRLTEVLQQLNQNIFAGYSRNPDLFKTRYKIENGKVIPIG